MPDHAVHGVRLEVVQEAGREHQEDGRQNLRPSPRGGENDVLSGVYRQDNGNANGQSGSKGDAEHQGEGLAPVVERCGGGEAPQPEGKDQGDPGREDRPQHDQRAATHLSRSARGTTARRISVPWPALWRNPDRVRPVARWDISTGTSPTRKPSRTCPFPSACPTSSWSATAPGRAGRSGEAERGAVRSPCAITGPAAS